MTSREIVRRTLRFERPERLAHDFPPPYGSDFSNTGMNPCPDARPSKGLDYWGCEWDCLGNTQLGEVKNSPLKNWSDFEKLTIPSIDMGDAWDKIKYARENAGDKYLLGNMISIYERVHFVRGLENAWCDTVEEPENLKRFVNLLADMNVEIINRYSKLGIDGVINCDDWGLQNRLMIDPKAWREIWKPAYARVYAAAHSHGIDTFLHSCGHISEIIGDLIDAGLDALHMDQQENMGLEVLNRFRGRITFYSPVDIQTVMPTGDANKIRAYCRKMAELLGTKDGGFIPRWYTDPASVGHARESIETMCEEFLKISDELYGG